MLDWILEKGALALGYLRQRKEAKASAAEAAVQASAEAKEQERRSAREAAIERMQGELWGEVKSEIREMRDRLKAVEQTLASERENSRLERHRLKNENQALMFRCALLERQVKDLEGELTAIKGKAALHHPADDSRGAD